MARRRDGSEHAPAFRVDLLDTVVGDLEEMRAVVGCPGMARRIERTLLGAALRIEGVEVIAGREPDMFAVECDAVDPFRIGEGPIFADDFSFGCLHSSVLAARRRRRE